MIDSYHGERYIALWLEGPMQAWGFESRFGYRSTAEFPTKSGVIGLIMSALGKGGAQRDTLAEFAKIKMTAMRYDRLDRQGVIQSQPVLTDFQLIGAAYDSDDKWQKLFQPKTAEGAAGSGAFIKYREYLQDTAFGVVLGVTEEQSQIISKALQGPVWSLYLGRKSCAPTEVIYQGCFEHEALCIAKLSALSEEKQRTLSISVFEGEQEEGELVTLNDVPVAFGETKEYAERVVTIARNSNVE